jgi:hypothetical protein
MSKVGQAERRDQTGRLLACYEYYCKDNVPPIHYLSVHRLPRVPKGSGQAPKSAQTWLPNKCSTALDAVPNPYYSVRKIHTPAPSLPRRPCLALHPCALLVHPPPTTAKASALASLMSGVASRNVTPK